MSARRRFRGSQRNSPVISPDKLISQRHHYIPVFYLKQWCAQDGRICEFSRPYDAVKPRMTHPKGTGYEVNLYTITGLNDDSSQIVEQHFMKRVDQLASDALVKLMNGSARDFDVKLKSGWSRFIMSLIQRNPQKVAWIAERIAEFYEKRHDDIQADYEGFRKDGDPPTFAEYLLLRGPAALAKSKALLL